MQQSTHQQQVTVSSLLGLMALAIAAGRSKAAVADGDAGRDAPEHACDLPARRRTACGSQAEAAAS
jgi:phosphotransferase system HPr-like phosphotransfer protein